jgi:enoyl-CoA hydratase
MNKEKEPPSSFATLLLERREAIVRISLNRPERLNALNSQLQNDFVQALDALAADDAVRVLILTGQGRAFCAGLDLRDFRQSLSSFQRPSASGNVFQALAAVPQPVIAAVNGPAVTGGLELVLACDVVIGSRAARFADTHARLGVMPGAGLSQRLPRIIGANRALALSLTGDFLEAEDAWRCGLLSHLSEPEELLPLAWQLAGRMATADPEVLREIKRVTRAGLLGTLAEGLRLEDAAHPDWARRADLAEVLARRENVLHPGGKASPP